MAQTATFCCDIPHNLFFFLPCVYQRHERRCFKVCGSLRLVPRWWIFTAETIKELSMKASEETYQTTPPAKSTSLFFILCTIDYILLTAVRPEYCREWYTLHHLLKQTCFFCCFIGQNQTNCWNKGWQSCFWPNFLFLSVLVRFRNKTHMIKVWRTSPLGLKYWFWMRSSWKKPNFVPTSTTGEKLLVKNVFKATGLLSPSSKIEL